MAISPLLSIVGTALAPLARDVVEQITDGLSFHQLLGGGNGSDVNDAPSPSGELNSGSPASPAAAQLEAIRRQPLQELEAFVERLRTRLSAAGIDLTEMIPLQVGRRGDIQVDGDHPDRAAIEELLDSDARLASTFRQLSNALVNQHNAASGEQRSNALRLTIDASQFNFVFQ